MSGRRPSKPPLPPAPPVLPDQLGASDVALLLLDRELELRFASPSARRLLAVAAGWPWTEPGQQAALQAALDSGSSYGRVLRAPDGSFQHCSIEPVKDEQGLVVALSVSLVDVTALEQARLAASDRLALLRAALRAKGGYLLCDESWRIVEAEPVFLETLGLAEVDPVGHFLGDFTLPALDPARLRPLWESPGRVELLRLDTPDGHPLVLAAQVLRSGSAPKDRLLLLLLTTATADEPAEPGRAGSRGPGLEAVQDELRRAIELADLLAATLARKTGGLPPLGAALRLGLVGERLRDVLAELVEQSLPEPPAALLAPVPLGPLLERVHQSVAPLAESKGLTLRTVRCSAVAQSDATLLEDALHGLLIDLVGRAPWGRIVLGCRRRGDRLRLEIRTEAVVASIDTGEAAQGGGLMAAEWLAPLAARRLARRPGHVLETRMDSGAMAASIVLQRSPAAVALPGVSGNGQVIPMRRDAGLTLLVDPDAELRETLRGLLEAEGRQVRDAGRVEELPSAIAEDGRRPHLLILASRPGGPDPGRSIHWLQEAMGVPLVALLLAHDPRLVCPEAAQILTRPVRVGMLLEAVAALAPPAEPPVRTGPGGQPVVFLVEADSERRAACAELLMGRGLEVRAFAAQGGLLSALDDEASGCILAASDGLELLARLHGRLDRLAAVPVARRGDVAFAVRAMQAGACDVLEHPVEPARLLAAVERALVLVASAAHDRVQQQDLTARLGQLSERERQILACVTAGLPNKEIAFRLGISRRTVENHRARIMQKMRARSLAELVRQTTDLGL